MEDVLSDSMKSLCSAMSAMSAMCDMSGESSNGESSDSDSSSDASLDEPAIEVKKVKRDYQYYDRRIISSLSKLNSANFRTLFRVTPGKKI